MRSSKIEQFGDLDRMLDKFYSGDQEVLHENANKDSKQFNTTINLTAGLVGKAQGIRMLPPHVAEAHIDGEIHFHDLTESPRLPMTNCFSRDTKFVTDKGVQSFFDYEDGDSITVLTPDGNWRRAVVKCYGKQSLNSVVLRKGASAPKEVHVTGNHRWILKDGTETTSLSIGDSLRGIAEPNRPSLEELSNIDDEYIEWWVRGFVYGDGSTYSKNGSRIRLCGEKVKYKEIFERVGFRVSSTGKYLDGDIVMVNYQIPKQIPGENSSIIAKEAFVNGWIEADGSFRNGNLDYKSVITIGKQDDIENFKRISSVAKYHIVGESNLTGQKTNFGERKETRTFRMSHGNYFTWKVIDIVEDIREDYVWCLEVEEEKAFVLEGGIPTGNCCLIDFEGMFKTGFTLGNAEVSSPKSIQTAAAQIAQVIANVSSSQYGGCSVDRIDELLAPYAKMNFDKHYEMLSSIVDKERAEEMAFELTKKDIYDSAQSIEWK